MMQHAGRGRAARATAMATRRPFIFSASAAATPVPACLSFPQIRRSCPSGRLARRIHLQTAYIVA